MKKVAIIVVTYNRLPLLKECINSLRVQTYKNNDIIVVNNGSTDGTDEWLSSQKDLIVLTQENTGGAGGFFTGLKYSAENGYEYSWIMDDDVEANQDTLSKLMQHTPNVKGFLCSRVIDINGNHCNVPRISMETSNDTKEWVWGNNLSEGLLKVTTTSFVSVLISNEVVKEVGLPFKEYFIWGDDTEYTTRISNNYPSYMVLDSTITHKRKLATSLSIFSETNPGRVRMYFYSYRNRIHNCSSKFRKCAFFLLGVTDSVKMIFKGNFKNSLIPIKGSIASIFFHPRIEYVK